MQALAERLDAAVTGTSLASVQPIQFSALKTFDPAPEALVGCAVTGIGSRGKYVVFDFDRYRLLVHLSQGGRVDLERPPKKTRPKFGVVRFGFTDTAQGSAAGAGISILIKEFGTERKAGWSVLRSGDDGPLTRLGPQPFSDAFEGLLLSSEDRRRVHTLLRDQRFVAGIGRGYSDDILHRAGVSPYTALAALALIERRALLDAVREILTEGLAAERRRTGGLPTKIGDHFTVHGRWGQECPRCGTTLRRVSYESHEVTYCPHCQTDDKVLADRRLSRLLR